MLPELSRLGFILAGSDVARPEPIHGPVESWRTEAGGRVGNEVVATGTLHGGGKTLGLWRWVDSEEPQEREPGEQEVWGQRGAQSGT